MSGRGMDGTVLGTLVMPYCSGLGNLIFAALLAAQAGPGREVIINCLVNNVTNITLLMGLPALIWGLQVVARKSKKRERQMQQVNRLSLLLTLVAGLFFTGVLWLLARDGELDRADGAVLIALFLFWQLFAVFDVLKHKVRQNQPFNWVILLDFALLLAGAYALYCSIEWIVDWVENVESAWLAVERLGWMTGVLMVVPNAGLAFYYAWRGRADIVASSQLGDGHICIPLCIGIFAVVHPIAAPGILDISLLILGCAYVLHAACLLAFGGLPRWFGLALIGAYGVFLWQGLA